MKKLILLALLFQVIVISGAQASSKPIPVTVSILPQKYFIEQIAGDKAKITVIVKPGAEPADYEPTPKQVTNLAHSKLYFAIGVPFEKAWFVKFQSANPTMKIINTARAIEKLPLAFNEHGERIKSGIRDPHIWLSPTLVRIQAMAIRDAFIRIDPKHAAYYQARYLKFAKEINALDNQLISILSVVRPNRNQFMVYHPAWGYFAEDYGLRQVAVEKEGKEPGPKQMARLIARAKQLGIKIIFVEPQFSQKAARTIAKQINGKVVVVDPLAEDWPANLQKVARILRSSG